MESTFVISGGPYVPSWALIEPCRFWLIGSIASPDRAYGRACSSSNQGVPLCD